jgi:hypothetical protein
MNTAKELHDSRCSETRARLREHSYHSRQPAHQSSRRARCAFYVPVQCRPSSHLACMLGEMKSQPSCSGTRRA